MRKKGFMTFRSKRMRRVIAFALMLSICVTSNGFVDRVAQARNVALGKVSAKKIKLNLRKCTLAKGKKVTLTAKVTPKKAAKSTVLWKSSKKAVATVNKKGVVTAKKTGSAKITATVKGTKKSATCTIKVVKKSASVKTKAPSGAKPEQTTGTSIQQSALSPTTQVPVTEVPSVQPTATPDLQNTTAPETHVSEAPENNATIDPETQTPSPSAGGTTAIPSVTKTPSSSAGATTKPTVTPAVDNIIEATPTPIPVVNDIDSSVKDEDLIPIFMSYFDRNRFVTQERISLSADKKSIVVKVNTSQLKRYFTERLLANQVEFEGMYQAVTYKMNFANKGQILEIYTLEDGLRVSYPIVVESASGMDDSWMPEIDQIKVKNIYNNMVQPYIRKMVKVGGTNKFYIGCQYIYSGILDTLTIKDSSSYDYEIEKAGSKYYITYTSLKDNSVTGRYEIIYDEINFEGISINDPGNTITTKYNLFTEAAQDYEENVQYLRIFGENESLGANVTFTPEDSTSKVTNVKFKHSNQYDGMLILTHNYQNTYFYYRYIQQPRTVKITSVQSKTNLISEYKTTTKNGNQVCELGGFLDEFGMDNTFTFNDGDISPKVVSFEKLSASSTYDYKLVVNYMDANQTIYITYKKSDTRFLPIDYRINGKVNSDQELKLVTVNGVEKLRVAGLYDETVFENQDYWSKITWTLPYRDEYNNPLSHAAYKIRTANDGKRYFDLCQKDYSAVVKSYEIYYEEIKLPEFEDFTVLDDSTSSDTQEKIDMAFTYYTRVWSSSCFQASRAKISGPDTTLDNIKLTPYGKMRWDSMKYVTYTNNAEYTGYIELTYKTQVRRIDVLYTQIK